MLLFKKKFLEQIRRGEKTQTIRLWQYRRMKSGQRSYVPGVGYIAITNVEPVELAQLTDADAILDGFPSADLLRKEIHSLYAKDDTGKLMPFKVNFSVYSPQEQQKIAEEQQKKKQASKTNQDCAGQRHSGVERTLGKILKIGRPPGG